jgi:Protein of unknown function (DUF4007)
MAFRFSGHETFPCRYAWLPKAFKEINSDPLAFADEEDAMIRLGVGKNMVRAIRFWMLETSIAEKRDGRAYRPTTFARAVLGRRGFDPFLEDIRTLWLIHWNLSTHKKDEPLFAWDFLLNHWQTPELSRSTVLEAFRKEANKEARPPSDVTLQQHFDTFLHTYFPTRSRKGDIQEDNLDCPLVELELIQLIGERRVDGTGRREAVYAFRREEKPEITPELFAYCLNDFWQQRWSLEKTLPFKEVAFGHGSPGQVFKLPEWNIRQRLEAISSDTDGFFRYAESATRQQVSRSGDGGKELLDAIYQEMIPC